MWNFFLKDHAQNMMEELFPGPFLKNQNWAHLWINSLKFYTVCFPWMSSWGLSQWCRPVAFTSYKAFFKNKKRSGTSLPASFSEWISKKNIFYYFFNKFLFLFFSNLQTQLINSKKQKFFTTNKQTNKKLVQR